MSVIGVLLKALQVGLPASLGTAGTLFGMSKAIAWPASNLAGYIVAGRILGAGAATSAKVAAVGGPVVAGGLASLSVGALVTLAAYEIIKTRTGK